MSERASGAPDGDRNLLFGVLALQTDLIDAVQFVEACTLWTTRKEVPLAELLIDKGWISPADRADIRRLLERKLKKHGQVVKASLAAVPDDIKRSLAALEDGDIQRSLSGTPPPSGFVPMATMDHISPAQDRYTLSRLHATGGIGRVWLARDGHLGRDVALKELRPEQAKNDKLWSRFLREARITGQLEHPGVVPVYELGRRPDNQQPFYTMRFVKGRTLSEAARAHHHQRVTGQEEPLELLALLNAFVVVSNTVAYAHTRGVIHRDLKGHNVILGDFGEVVVLDWGLAKLVDQPLAADAETLAPLGPEEASGEVDLTAQGQAMGTPAYMAPEQAAGRLDQIDRRTDVYGLGAILYEILTGQPPFTGAETNEVLRKVRDEVPIRPCQLWAGVPPMLEAACLRALAKEPGDRFPSATTLAQEVQHWQEMQRRQAEEALRQQSALLQLLQVAAVAANEASAIEDALQIVLDQVCAHTGWPVGHAYILAEDAGELVPTAVWHLANPELFEAFRKVTEATRMRPGMGLPGRILASGKPAWIMDVTQDANFPRAQLAEHIGVKAAFGFPILAGTEVVAVLEFFAPEALAPNEPLLEVMAHIGTQLGRVVERRRAERALEQSQAWYHSLVENVPQNIFRKNLSGQFTFGNQRFFTTLERPGADVIGKTDFDFFPPQLAEKYRGDDRAVIDSGKTFETVEEHVTPAGEKLYVQVIKTPIYDGRGEIMGTQGIFWDVTERKRAEVELAHERDLLNTLMDNVPDNIYFKDSASRFIRINQALSNYFGLTDPAQAIGKTDFDFFTKEHAQPAYEDEQEIIRSGQPVVSNGLGTVPLPVRTISWVPNMRAGLMAVEKLAGAGLPFGA